MCGTRRRKLRWLCFFFLYLPLLAMSQGGHGEQLVHAKEDQDARPLRVMNGGGRMGEQRLSRVGSRPPCCACERRCGGCAPCTAVQVRAGAGVQCANYEPIRWTCKCGGAVFDP
ncbi:hypothetical protein BRADI_2g05865v3 [Brachypodium distachyon]|uniref:Epidermal patterning factor-like protein n=2 Tax=Brachypodium distachyon TaxID=15368 RepID=A0A0Q3MFE4_BRADI|nr:hypothetical protein BRADI_2g05865v3 [Brachypodium distachyon]